MEVRIENINQDVNLVADIKQLITNARLKVATVANAGITMLYWHIGRELIVKCLEINGRSTASELCQRCRHNYSRNMAVRNFLPAILDG